jgi:hypothetical protein
MPTSRSRGERPTAEYTDEELVQRFQYLKSETAQGDAGEHLEEALRVEYEMRRRGLQPDREDVIPDDPMPNEANVKPAH